ncbi:MAG: bifunctional phosphoribosyl-AMP cyclohydrolase/phosphoribosyl-ATP diphosphatase HisIE [Flavobacteriaceae bacterium]|nr:bifunctional phosphoribosyl-AMP cyclohydrolase/phosphoribosyl-ATP diphosphatase HisIE [Muriicola sp.]NNK20580.1 bifunctional phosphoribosyl-AMP cyclohydrolase/phosphoribosyl-ATP diphosphatase HisIE [Flavobacteriaceae bacterium]NNL38289.1 bifunctional phosphoribosyl-AMP cyclohydrolase/phosphoribosyl-ATP diphosphatase HisIE [Flavobacteriaceae bacterium]
MKIDFAKNKDGLVPAIIQDVYTQKVLMLGYMNQDALDKTMKNGRVTFYSRTKKRLWTKGEESGNYLEVVNIQPDCDLDTLLIKVVPEGPTCHKGTDTCWGTENKMSYGFLSDLEKIITDRQNNATVDKSYVASLFENGINKIAQKVGEEAVEVVIEAKDNNDSLFLSESADLLFHFLILLRAKGYDLDSVVRVLQDRH